MSDADRDSDRQLFDDVEVQSLQRRAGTQATELVNAAAALDIVRRYVDAERRRNRRIVVWTGTVALFIVLFVLTAFISIGIFVLSRTRQTADHVDEVQAEARSYADRVSGLTNRITELQDLNQSVAREFREGERMRIKSNENLRSNLRRFSRWVVDTGKSSSEGTRSQIEERLARIERQAAAREDRLAALRRDYSLLEAEYTDLQSALTQQVAGPVATGPGETSRVFGGDAGPGAPAQDDLDRALASIEATLAQIKGSTQEPGAATPDVQSSLRPSGAGDDTSNPGAEVCVIQFPNGDRYEGQVKYGLLHGWGAYASRNGDRYEGNFRYDMRVGKGSLITAHGDKYVGEFKDDRMHGPGTIIYANGNRYDGEFKDGRKDGRGQLKFANGDVYKGNFSADARTGIGVYAFSNGDKYEGDFLDGQRHGQGRYTYAAGGEYAGAFKNGYKEGQGVSVYPDGRRVSGLWEKDDFIRATPL